MTSIDTVRFLQSFRQGRGCDHRLDFHSTPILPGRRHCGFSLLAVLLASLLMCGCDPGTPVDSSTAEGNRGLLRIVVTTSMVGDLVRNVVGDRAEVIGLMGEGIDPHLFRPTARDLGLMMQADLIFYSGLGLEGAMQSAFERAEKNGKRVIPVTRILPREKLIFSQRFSGHPDPHVWNDAGLWAACLDEVVTILRQHLPDHAEELTRNTRNYRQELQQLDDYARESIRSIPAHARYLVTAHDAFSYFARAYQIEEKSVQGITTESEPGVQDINHLVDFLTRHHVPALFVEATVNSANLKAVIEGARQKGWAVRIGGMLYSDSMGMPGTYEGTYVGMVDHNVTAITRALGGSAPERGFQGKLSSSSGSSPR